MTTLFLAHPSFDKSQANRAIVEHFQNHNPASIVRHLDKEYPSYIIDVPQEQELILASQTIILQFPVYWYYSPAFMKKWLDEVLTIDLLNEHKDKLRNKKLIISCTAGGTEESYTSMGENQHLLSEYLVSFPKIANFMNITFQDFIISYEASPDSNDFIQRMYDHAERLCCITD